MHECEKYEEMISAYLDGELSAEDTQELVSHIQVCPSCASLMKTYSTLFAPTKLVAPPGGFTASVMGMTGTARPPQRAKKRAPIIRILAAAAACLVLVIAIYPLASSLGGRMESSADDAAEVNAAAAGGVSTPESASVYTLTTASVEEETSTAESGSYGKDSSDGDSALFITDGVDALAQTESDESASEECDDAEEAVPEAESEVVADSSTQVAEDTRLSAASVLIAVYIHGELPEICSGLEFQDLGDGSYAAEINADLAAKLMAMDYEHDEGDVRYLVWYPD